MAAAISGTITPESPQSEVVAGGQTIIITLTGDTWVTEPTFETIRSDIWFGITSAQSESFGWNIWVQAQQDDATVIRTSDTVVTITLEAAPSYLITAKETITVTVPAVATTGPETVGTPTFDIVLQATVSGYLPSRPPQHMKMPLKRRRNARQRFFRGN